MDKDTKYTTTLSGETEAKSHSDFPWGFLYWPVLLVCVYVMFFGPVGACIRYRVLPRQIGWVYIPLQKAAQSCPTLKKILVWYLDLWTGDDLKG